jgi:hypothetical protein
MYTILLIILILLLLGALPTWPYSRSWGYYPSGGLGLVVVILIVLLLLRQATKKWLAVSAAATHEVLPLFCRFTRRLPRYEPVVPCAAFRPFFRSTAGTSDGCRT